ncbi:invasion associated locus B family protein [Mesorhizobium sp. B2-5-13]|uniref:invasion associated locus B family protein n=1 Tax=unclassified Mesorhizobium TaxID=325217 RepID=UPI001125EB53|nr:MULTISPECIES: invasion associated locus B family protein [unclassified Mesorhizobium]TPJ44369.1 invasion associated locus B family protein [Mesorhizobium sp. B2-6-5]TPJ90626.1 invasion associated locus B family protein [Mesorhizobium sp. B2-5-13]TPK54741.1 invasion associated locus B family protein [Mesorhizobium sp. B2-5-5]
MKRNRRVGYATLIAASLLSLAASFAQDTAVLPGGATSLREGHGDWTVSCNLATQNNASVKVCALSQEQTDSQSRQRVLAMELRPAGETVQGTLVLPFGLALEKGVTLQIDDGLVLPPLRFRTCLPGGCIVDLAFDAETLATLRNGKSLKVKVVADGGKETNLALSLNGFPSAVDRTVALLK